MADQHFCQNCHRNFKRSLPQRCPHCDSPDIVETRGACHVPGCPYPKLDSAETCGGHTAQRDGDDSQRSNSKAVPLEVASEDSTIVGAEHRDGDVCG